MKQEYGTVCSDASVTLGPASVSDTLIAPFLGPQYNRLYVQRFLSNLQKM